MPDKYFPPDINKHEFHCPFCGVYAHQLWSSISAYNIDNLVIPGYISSRCLHCGDTAIWYSQELVYPLVFITPEPPDDLPLECRGTFQEAREVYPVSSRAAAALLRLCIQQLMPHLGQKGKNLNDDIKNLVKNGLSPTAQKALDYCRVIGNNAVHPGQIQFEDSPEIASSLFHVVVYITNDRITQPKTIETLYQSIPEQERENIEKRDNPKS